MPARTAERKFGRVGLPIRTLGEERGDAVGALGVEQRADDIDEPAARLHQLGGDGENVRLRRRETLERGRIEPPARLGIAPPGACPRAGRIDQHRVGLAAPRIERGELLARIEQHRLRNQRPRPFGPRAKLRQAAAVGVGGGGKTLALAADMANGGTLIAADTDRDRVSQLAPRAERAGALVAETVLLDPGKELDALDAWRGKADAVLVDAPCSGTGTWRRNPEARWRP